MNYTLSINNINKKIPKNYNKLVIPGIEKITKNILGDLIRLKIYNYIIYYYNKNKLKGYLDTIYIYNKGITKKIYYKITKNKITLKLQ